MWTKPPSLLLSFVFFSNRVLLWTLILLPLSSE
jgi:hypothetical protein